MSELTDPPPPPDPPEASETSEHGGNGQPRGQTRETPDAALRPAPRQPVSDAGAAAPAPGTARHEGAGNDDGTANTGTTDASSQPAVELKTATSQETPQAAGVQQADAALVPQQRTESVPAQGGNEPLQGQSAETASEPAAHDRGMADTGASAQAARGHIAEIDENQPAGGAARLETQSGADLSTPQADQQISDRIAELKHEGPGSHGPQRHLEVDDTQLQQRLGTPSLNPDGTARLGDDGFVAATEKIDPMTGTTTDAITGREHGCGPFATRFDSPADFAHADSVLRERARTGEEPAPSESIEKLLGADGHSRMTGYSIDPASPGEYLPVNFEGGSIQAVYRYDDVGEPYLYTMYPQPASGTRS